MGFGLGWISLKLLSSSEWFGATDTHMKLILLTIFPGSKKNIIEVFPQFSENRLTGCSWM
jgi:hypothetical protein